MKLNRFKWMSVTIAFFFLAVVEAATVWGLAETGHELVAGHDPGSWISQSVYIAGYLVLAGLMVDLSRLAVSALWRRVLKSQHSPGNHGRHGFA